MATNSYSIDPTKVVSKAQFDAKVTAAYQNTARIETPAEDIQILANLLGVSPGALAGSGAGFRKGGEACGHCGRAFSILDIVETGLQAHSKEFLVDVITGKYGYIANTVNAKAYILLPAFASQSQFERASQTDPSLVYQSLWPPDGFALVSELTPSRIPMLLAS
ncbi:hypothetical protein FB451DRAFT_1368739 [Mycena latifolia]|nr:hypothetical protein FB451DRAFT_1368739 [Mycena latifolia]